MTTIPSETKEKILEIAHRVRKEQFEDCNIAPRAQCEDASWVLSSDLRRAKIAHNIVGGMWLGPLWEGFEEAELERGAAKEMEVDTLHVWIEFPQWDGAILDITADQFYDVPSVWFPATKEYYESLEVIFRWTPRTGERAIATPHPPRSVQIRRYRRRK